MGLTKIQADFLAFVKSSVARRGVVPSYPEIMEHLGFKSKSSVHRLIGRLEDRGYVRRLHGQARALELIEPGSVIVCFHCGNPAGSKACRAAADLDRALRNSSLQDAGQTVRPSAATGVRT